MLKTSLIGGILGGIILFVWSTISWVVLPWHTMTIHSFKDQTAIMQTIQNNVPQSGIYLAPSFTNQAQGPMVFAAIDNKGMPTSMTPAMITAFITQIIAAFLVTWMLTKTNLSYAGRLGFTVIFALTAGVVTELPYWNWFHFDTTYTLVMFADLLIGWFLAGLLLAKLTAPRS